jgi:leucyl-tRNA synthetase
MVLKDGAKMSKSKGNVVDPENIMGKYGADTARLFILFAAPPEKDLEWSDKGVEGAQRFLNRIWRLVSEHKNKFENVNINLISENFSKTDKDLYRKLHQTIKDVSSDLEQRFNFNTAISSIMELVNSVYQYLNNLGKEEINYSLLKNIINKTLLLLAPFAPHMTEELWRELGYNNSIHQQQWPDYSEEALKKDEITIVVQVNGKVRDKIQVSSEIKEDNLKEKALSSSKITKYTEGKEIIKTIVIPGKLINIVVK